MIFGQENDETSDTSSDKGGNSHRRFTLVTQENPNSSIDYLIALGAKASDELSRVSVNYVPDKLLLQHEAFEHYLHSFKHDEIHSLESLALTILDDLNNEVIPRWVQVCIISTETNHRVLVEDRQPIWSNENLVSRVRKF